MCFRGCLNKIKNKNLPPKQLTGVITVLESPCSGDDGWDLCFGVDCPFKECQLQMPVLYSSERLTIFTKINQFSVFFTYESVVFLQLDI